MKVFVRAAIAAAIACGCVTSASASVVVDQSSTGTVDREFRSMQTLGQSFTPTGNSISTASFMLKGLGSSTITVALFSGAGYAGQLLGTSRATTIDSTYGMKEFSFAPITLTPDNVYTFRLTTSTSSFSALATGDVYSRGMYYGSTGYSASHIDLIFSEGYTSAVPEPATWAMLTLGMGAVGFAMRRRRKAGTLAAAV